MASRTEVAFARARGVIPRPGANVYPLFEALADFIPQFTWMCTPDGLNVYFNQRWVEYTGLTSEESRGKGWNTPFHPDDKQAAWDAWNHATETGEPYQIQSRLRAADGSYRWFLMRGEPLKNAAQEVLHWFGSCTDIDDSTRAKDVLRQQAALLDVAHDAIFVRNANSEIAFWNRGAEELYGWAREEAGGRVTHQLLKTRFPKPLDMILADVEEHGSWEGELVHTRKDGLEITVASRWAAQRDQSGLLMGVLEINRDVTERKRAEAALEAKNRELERSNRDLDQFAYLVSHDLQEPVRAVRSYVQLLSLRLEDVIESADCTVLLGVIEEGASRIQRMIGDILAFSRVSLGGEIEFTQVDLNQAVESARKNLPLAGPDTDIQIVSEPLPVVLGNLSQLALVFQNLIGNAIKYRSAEPLRVSISASREGDTHRVSVRDNGIGIAPQHHDRIFELFRRLHSASAIPGTGLGLTISQRIIEHHGGRIWVESEIGNGATFFFTLPTAPAP